MGRLNGKQKKEQKRRRLEDGSAEKIKSLKPVIPNKPNHIPASIVAPVSEDVIPPEDLAITVATLAALDDNPEFLKSRSCKALRTLIFQLQKTITGDAQKGKSLTGRISDALMEGRWVDAMCDLEEMRNRNQTPKLGALQRWVRDCDAASGKDGSYGNPIILRVLDSVLRTADPALVSQVQVGEPLHPVRRHPPWEPIVRNLDNPIEIYDNILKGGFISEEKRELYKNAFRIVHFTKGPERRTPNLYDFTLYHSNPGVIVMKDHAPVQRIDVPSVPNAFVLTNVLSVEECHQIIAATESIGFTGDKPLAGAAGASESVLAHNFFWLADSHFLETVFERCRPHFPAEVQGGKVLGLNARFRVYRYVPGAIYRPHIDGAWPGSGLCPNTGSYMYDAYEGKRWSRLTFLLYLNDEAQGGATTFFVPSNDQGFMNAFAVTPRTGMVLCFPHGDTNGSLLHEGSPVISGAKYVIRTDVLYHVDK